MLTTDLSVPTDPVQLSATLGNSRQLSATLGGWRDCISRLLLVGVGLLLLAAAVLKLRARDAGTLGQNSVLFSPPVQMLSVVAEVVLAAWLLGGWWRSGAWAAAALFFALMAGVSLWLAAQGQSTCGCFGRVAVHPWATFGLDVMVLAALAVSRPKPLAWPTMAAEVRPAVAVAAGALALVTIGSLGLMAHWGVGTEGLVARLRGQPVSIAPFVTDLGTGHVGDVAVFKLAVANHSGHNVRLVGGSASCSCAVLDELPLDIPAGSDGRWPCGRPSRERPGGSSTRLRFTATSKAKCYWWPGSAGRYWRIDGDPTGAAAPSTIGGDTLRGTAGMDVLHGEYRHEDD